MAYFVEGDPAKAAHLAGAAARDAAEAGLPRAGALRMQGSALSLLGDPAWPAKQMEESLAAARDEDDIPGIFSSLNNLVTAHESGVATRSRPRAAGGGDASRRGVRLGRARHMQTRRISACGPPRRRARAGP